MAVTLGAAVGSGQHRVLGALAAAGGVAYFIAGVVILTTRDDTHPAVNVLGVVWALGCLCGLIGIGVLGGVGRGLFGRLALAVTVVAYALAALDGLLILAGAYRPEDSPLFVISRLGTLVGMLLVGIAAVAARRWPGWRRFSPFALLLALPIAVAVGAATGAPAPVPFVGLAWVLIGYAVWSTPAAE